MGCLEEKGAQFHILHQGMCWNTGYCPGICREQRPRTGHILLLNCEKVHKSILYPFIIVSTFRQGEMAFYQRCSELSSDTFESCVPVSSAWTRVTFASDGWELAKSGKEICNIWNLGWTRKTVMNKRPVQEKWAGRGRQWVCFRPSVLVGFLPVFLSRETALFKGRCFHHPFVFAVKYYRSKTTLKNNTQDPRLSVFRMSVL